MSAADQASHAEMANAIRVLSMDAIEKANSGHPGMPMGFADVATVLFTRFLKFNPANPNWPDRDRFVLSAGHGSMLQYSLLYLTGYPEMEVESLKNFRQLHSNTPGHPEFGDTIGVETTTGPLGQGLANAVGMAIAERILNGRYGSAVYDHNTYAVVGDGCLMEGISQEAITLAGHLKLGKLITLFDDNEISIDGATDLSTSDDQLKRFEAAGWHVARIDGHNPEEIATAIQNAKNVTDKPSLIACKTQIGKGAPNKQGTSGIHGSPLGADEITNARTELNWPHEPFVVPENILSAWRAAGTRSADAYASWESAWNSLSADDRASIENPMNDTVRANLKKALDEYKAGLVADMPKLATRVSSQKTLEAMYPAVPTMVGGSADLTPSNGTKTSHYKPVTSEDYSGNYIHYGVREHGMAAAMNGIVLHGGLIPFGATFLVFTDYCRPSIRLSALMKQRVVYVMTHDSIGLGEDGPTHQPVEHVSSLRAMPNVNVFRPADAVETAECWELSLTSDETPSILALTRQGIPALRDNVEENKSAKGAYVLREADGERQVTLLATGSEVSLAIEAADKLKEEGVNAAVVSMPCWELFEAQSPEYRKEVLGSAPRVAVEAGARLGWDRWLGENGAFIGMQSFGASAPINALYEHFNITVENIVKTSKELV